MLSLTITTPSMSAAYKKLKVAELRVRLTERGLRNPGLNKNGMIHALHEADRKAAEQERTLMTLAKQQQASLTKQSGADFLQDTAYIRQRKEIGLKEMMIGGMRKKDRGQRLGRSRLGLQIKLATCMVGALLLMWLCYYSLFGPRDIQDGNVSVTVSESSSTHTAPASWHVC